MRLYVLTFFFIVLIVLPLLSFLRSHAIFRGGGHQLRGEGRHARQAWLLDAVLRMMFLGTLFIPCTYGIYRPLRLVELSSSASGDAACVSNHCITGIPPIVMWFLQRLPLLPSTVVLIVSFVLYFGYVHFFYLDGRERSLILKRHNNNCFNRLFNLFKFYIYLPYTKWKCYCVRDYFGLELVPAYGPLPLFRYPTEENLKLLRELKRSREEAADRLPSDMDDWDADELKELNAQRHKQNVVASFSGVSSSDTSALNAENLAECAEAHASSPDNTTASAQASSATTPLAPAAVERTSYFIAAHPHGILPICSFVSLMSNVVGRDRILFVDNRGLTGTSSATHTYETSRFPTWDSSGIHGDVAEGQGAEAIASPITTPAITHREWWDTIPAPAAAIASPHAPSLPPPDASRGSSNHASHSPGFSPAASPLLSQHSAGGQSLPGSVAALPIYAKARHYLYDEKSGRFVLLPSRDESVPPAGLAPAPVVRPKRRRDALRVRVRAVVASFPFYVPVMREIYLFQGMLAASYQTCKRVLEYNNKRIRQFGGRHRPPNSSAASDIAAGSVGTEAPSPAATAEEEYVLPNDLNHLLLYPGGASEAFLSSPHGPSYLLLRRRKGFLRVVLQTHSALVPCYTFGETDYYEQYETNATRFAAPYEDDDSLYLSRHRAQHGQRRESDASACDEEAGEDGKVKGASTQRESVTDDTASMFTSYYRKVMQSSGEGLQPSSSSTKTQEALPTSPQQQFMTSSSPNTEREAAEAETSLRRRPFWRTKGESACMEEGENGGGKADHQGVSLSCFPPSHSSDSSHVGTHKHTWVEAIQRLFQQTFGVSLPILKHLLPKSGVKVATVVGRPIYFELPESISRMYSNPKQYYDKERERQLLAAAQEVYIRELQNLFYMYAPVYLKDHSRRKLIII